MSTYKYSKFDKSTNGATLSGVKFRLAEIKDQNALSQMHIDRDGGSIDSVRQNYLREIELNGQGNTLFVAEYGNQIVGFGRYRYLEGSEELGYRNMPKGHYLLGVVVRENFRRKGIGTGLVRIRLYHIKSLASHAYTFVDEINDSMISLLRKMGFIKLTNDFDYPRLKKRYSRILFELKLEDFLGISK